MDTTTEQNFDGATFSPQMLLALRLFLSKYGNSFSTGEADRNLGGSTGAQTIAHNLNHQPHFFHMTGFTANGATIVHSVGSFDGTTMNYSSLYGTTPLFGTGNVASFSDGGGNTQSATVTVDSKNINLTWTKGGAGLGGTLHFIWYVF